MKEHIISAEKICKFKQQLYMEEKSEATVAKYTHDIKAFADFLQTVSDLRHRHLLQRDVGKTDDGVHRRPNVMGHIVQENRLCLIGPLCLGQRLL